MATFDLRHFPHRRWNPLTREWILVSPHRTQRPWLGQTEAAAPGSEPRYDPTCYMCPGNIRAAGARNPNYSDVFVFDNDYPALLPDTPEGSIRENNLIVAESESGICRVLCFSPRHDLTLAGMTVVDIEKVVETWCSQFQELENRPGIQYVQIFENRGAMMGASNPHPHCQIWASAGVPNEPKKEGVAQQEFEKTSGTCLLCEYLALEQRVTERVVVENQHFLIVVPFWAVWPFETLVLAKRHLAGFEELTTDERVSLAEILKEITSRYDGLFRTPFPYSMGFHPRPSGDHQPSTWHFHAHFYPPLLRSATIRKFMVGYEMLGTPQRDITAESAAERLRQVSDSHAQ
jgi:UDPglucose--hexose-1-phosphate uridylyltransferase